MQADVASLVAQRHWDDAFDAAVECSRAIKDLTGYPAKSSPAMHFARATVRAAGKYDTSLRDTWCFCHAEQGTQAMQVP